LQGDFYPREEGSARLISYSDSDLAGDLDSRKALQVFCFSLEIALLAGNH
jgi:hypothetical protein